MRDQWARGTGFRQVDLCRYLGCQHGTLLKLMAAVGVPKTELLSREQAARIIAERRRRQGARVLRRLRSKTSLRSAPSSEP